jgi:hypothetical protein
MDEVYCEDCGAMFRNDCHCDGIQEVSEKEDRWVGMDGHAYVGDKKRSSMAMHDTDNCRCPSSPNFDPDSWY